MTRSEPTTPPRGYAFGAITLCLVSPLIAWLPTLATGTGWSQALYLLGGILIGAGGGAIIAHRLPRPWAYQLALLASIALAAATVGYVTARPDPATLFARIFKFPPPPDVTDLRGRLQWYDGQIALLRFHAGVDVIDRIVSQSKLVPDEAFAGLSIDEQRNRLTGMFYAAPIADADWRSTITFQLARAFETPTSVFPAQAVDGSNAESVRMLVNESGDAWVMYNQH